MFRRGYNRAKIHTARPNDPDMSPKRTKKERLFIHRTEIRPSDDIVTLSCHWLDISGYQNVQPQWMANCEFGCGSNLKWWQEFCFLIVECSTIVTKLPDWLFSCQYRRRFSHRLFQRHGDHLEDSTVHVASSPSPYSSSPVQHTIHRCHFDQQFLGKGMARLH